MFSFLKKYFSNSLNLFFFFFSFYFTVVSQDCNFINWSADNVEFIYESDFTVGYENEELTSDSWYQTDSAEFDGIDFTTYLAVDYPLCGPSSIDAGCFSIVAVNPQNNILLDEDQQYVYQNIGFNSDYVTIFNSEVWFSNINGSLVFEDDDGDGFILEDDEIPEAIDDNFNVPIPADSTSLTFYAVIRYYCASNGDEICQEEVMPITVTWPTEIEASITEWGNVSCYGFDDGFINVSSVNGGTSPFSYSWYIDSSDGVEDFDGDGQNEDLYYISDSNPNLTNAEPGVYSLIITDSNNCEFLVPDINTIITEPDSLILSFSTTDALCYGEDSGTITYIVSGGTPTYNLDADFIEINTNGQYVYQNLTLFSGEYSSIITDSSGCETVVEFVIGEPDPISVFLLDTTNVSCFGGGDGAAVYDISGGTEPYDYEDPTGLLAGLYTDTIIDGAGCEFIFDFEITEPDTLILTAETTDPSCVGFDDGTVIYTITGGTEPYEELLDQNDLIAGFYTDTITDANGCEAYVEFTIQEPDDLTVEIDSSASISCFGFSDGSIDVTVTGGSVPYTYTWSNGATIEDISDIGPGFYSLTVTDNNDCEVSSIEVEIIEPDALDASILSITNPDCNGDFGSIELSISGGSPPYETEDLLSFLAGSYTTTVIDSNGCEISLDFEITEPDPISVTAGPLAECPPTPSTLFLSGQQAFGGTPPYTYTWYLEDEDTGILVEQDSPEGWYIEVTQSGLYSIEVQDSTGCISTTPVPFSNYLVDLEYEVVDSACYNQCDGVVNIFPTGSFDENWILFYADNDIDDDGVLSLDTTETSTIILLDDDIDGDGILNDDDPDTDGDGFLDDDDIFPSGSLYSEYVQLTDASIDENGNSFYQIDSLCEGSYFVIAVENFSNNNDPSECESYIMYFDVGEYSEIIISGVVSLADNGFEIGCFGDSTGSIDLTVIGGSGGPYIYSWSSGQISEDLSDLSAGSYTVLVEDNSGCESIETFDLTQPDQIIITESHENLLCNGDSDGSIDITVTGGSENYTYAWSNGQTTEDISDLPSGTYTLIVTDSDNCTESLDIIIEEPEILDVSSVIFSYDCGFNISCQGNNDGSIDLEVVGGAAPYTYAWSNGQESQDLSGLSAGIYSVTITDENGCFVDSEYIILEPDALTATATYSEDVLCVDGSDAFIDLDVDGACAPYTYEWSNGETSQDLSGVSAGTYSVNITDENGCLFQISDIEIIGSSEIIIEALDSSILNLDCFGDSVGSIDLTVSGGVGDYTYLWSTGDSTQNISNLSSGIYTVTVTDSNNCSNTLDVEIFEPNEINIIADITSLACGSTNGSIDLTVTGGVGDYIYEWSNGEITEDIFDLSAGNYSVSVVDANGCEEINSFEVLGSDSSVIIEVDSVQNSSCFSFSFNDGAIEVTVSGGSGLFEYTWTSTNGFSSISFLQDDIYNLSAGVYSLSVLDILDGCVYDSSPIEITEPTPIEFFEDIDSNGTINSTADYSDYVCEGICEGQISFDINGGTSPYLFQLIDSSGFLLQENSSGIFNGLCAGCYNVNVYDANWNTSIPDGCYNEFPFCIQTSSTVINADIIQAGCSPSGSASFLFEDLLNPIDISLSLNDLVVSEELDYVLNEIDFNVLDPGSYQLVVEDSIGCELFYDFEITSLNNDLEIIDLDIDPPTCYSDTAFFSLEFSSSITSDEFPFSGYVIIEEDVNNDCIFDSLNIVSTIPIDSLTNDSVTNTMLIESIPIFYGANYVFSIEDNTGCSVDSCFTVNWIPEFNSDIYLTFSGPNTCFDESGSATVSWDPLDVGGTAFIDTTYFITTNNSDPDTAVILLQFDVDTTYNIQVECNDDTFMQEIEDNGDGVIDEQDIMLFLENTPDFCDGIIMIDDENDTIISGPYFSDPYYTVEWVAVNDSSNILIPDGWNSVTELAAGEYYVVVTDANDCVDTTYFEIEQPPDAIVTGASSSISSTTCCNSCDGEITISPYGGVADFYIVNVSYLTPDGVYIPYSEFSLFPGVNPDTTLSGLCPGEYEIIVHDSTNEVLDVCPSAEDNIVISAPACLDWIIETEPLECYGDTLIWGGDANNDYYSEPQTGAVLYWFSENEDAIVNNLDNALDVYTLGVGVYNLLSVDLNGCVQDMGQWEIEGPDQLQSDINIYESDTLIYCNGESTGIISINTYYMSDDGVFSEATDPITYLWYFNGDYIPQYDNQNIVQNLPAGEYEIIVNNQYNCGPIVHDVSVIEPDPLSVFPSQTDLLCYGDTNGTISLDIQGGLLDTTINSDYTYIIAWFNEDDELISTDSTLNNLVAGQYTSVITTGIPGDEVSFCDLLMDTIVLEQPELFQFGSIEPSFVSCQGELDGGLDIEILGGTEPYTFDWDFIEDEFSNDGELISEGVYSINNQGNVINSISGLGEGVYTLTVIDDNNCDPISYVLDLGQPLELVFESGAETNSYPASCSEGNGNSASGQISIHLDDLFAQITGGTSFNDGDYNNPFIGVDTSCGSVSQYGNVVGDSIVFSNLAGDADYTICLTDSVGCFTSYSVSVFVENPNPIMITPVGVDATCDDNGSIYITEITNGTSPYNIVIYNDNNDIAYDFSNDEHIQWFELENPGNIYDTNPDQDWNDNDLIDFEPDVDGDGINNDEDGDIDDDGIPNNIDNDIDGDGILNFGLDGIEGNSDDDGTPYGGNSDPDFAFSNFGWYNDVPPGDYYVSVTDSEGCTGELVFISILADIPAFPINTLWGNCYWNTDQTCDSLTNTGSIEINPNDPNFVSTLYPYTIFLDGEVIDVIEDIEDWDSDEDGLPDVYVINSSDTTVAGQPITIEAGTAYTVSITNGNGCGYINNGAYHEIEFWSNLDVDIVGFCPECEESSNGGFAYTLNTIENDVLSGTQPNISIDVLEPANNDDLNILYVNSAEINNSLSDCLTNSDLDNDGIYDYADAYVDSIWNGNDIDDHILESVIQFDGSLIDEEYYVVDNMWWDDVPDPNALVNYHQDYLNLLDDTTDYIIGGFGYGNYEITITDQYGCQFTEEIDISNTTCRSQFGSQQWENCLFIPSVFTPNSDGINDFWDIYNIELYEDSGVKVTVFNRWGQIVYQNTTDNVNLGTYSDKLWNGQNLQGTNVQIATYYYIVELDGVNKNYTGYVVVKR